MGELLVFSCVFWLFSFGRLQTGFIAQPCVKHVALPVGFDVGPSPNRRGPHPLPQAAESDHEMVVQSLVQTRMELKDLVSNLFYKPLARSLFLLIFSSS